MNSSFRLIDEMRKLLKPETIAETIKDECAGWRFLGDQE